MASDVPKYHERQHLQHCLKHTLNNLLQFEAFTTDQLNRLSDSIGAQRTWILGNYDVNLLEAALAMHNLAVRWHSAADVNFVHLFQQQLFQGDSSKDVWQEAQQHQQQQKGCSESVDCPEQQRNTDIQQQQACIQHQALDSESTWPPQQQQQQQQGRSSNGQHCRNRSQPANCAQQQHPNVQQVHAGDVPDNPTHLPKQQEQQEQQIEDLQGGRPAHQQHKQHHNLFGFILNVRSPGWWGALTGGRHWLAIKCINGCWWNLDSKLPAPVSFAGMDAVSAAAGHDEAVMGTDRHTGNGADRLVEYLQQQLKDGAHLFEVYAGQQ